MTEIIIHHKQGHTSSDWNANHLQLYTIISELAAIAGANVQRRVRDQDIKVGTRTTNDDRFNDGNLHIIDDRQLRMPNVLNAGMSYFPRFWHLDPLGIKGFSSIGNRTYDPHSVSEKWAQKFFKNQCSQKIKNRKSRYNQPTKITTFPDGIISVFFQGRFPQDSGATKFSDIQMLRTVLKYAPDQIIVVKPHPIAFEIDDAIGLQKLAEQNKQIIITDANIHDMLAVSTVTVSINSTVAMEGFLHHVPAILFGQSDFHHFAETVNHAGGFPAAYQKALLRKTGYEKFLFWYFRKNCMPIHSDNIHELIWDEFSKAGFPKERFLRQT